MDAGGAMAESETAPVARHLGRNDPCHCGSGKKYKHCCLSKDEEIEREARARAAERAAAEAPVEDERADREARKTTPRRPPDQPWKGARKNLPGFHKIRGPRKIGSS
jgi:hypothetical protein